MSLTIGKLAAEAGVGVETIRFYQKRGLVAEPAKTKSYRVYREDDVARIRFIKRAQGLGFTLSEIADLIELDQDQDAECGDLQDRAKAKISLIDQKLADLTRMRSELERLAATCAPDQPLTECRLMGCFSGRC